MSSPGDPLSAGLAGEQTALPAPAGPRCVLQVRGLVRTYGAVRAVDGLDLNVHEGEIYGFLGRNGAGKTTTIRILMGIIRPDRGTITLQGRSAPRPTVAQKRLIGYVAQEQHFYPWMTCEALGRFVGGFYPSWDDAEFKHLLDVFELPARRKVSELSHGTRVKLALALAVAPRPPLLILDEPTAGLDPVARREFLEITKRHAHAAGQTVFFSSHLVDEVERVADRVGIIDRGHLVYEGGLGELRAWVRGVTVDPASPLDPPAPFRVLRRAPGEPVVLMAPPEAWQEHAELRERAAAHRLSLDDMFIALVGRMPEA